MNNQEGFVLTRQARDVLGKAQIDLWVKTESGPVHIVIPNQKPVFFVESEYQNQVIELLNAANIEHEITPLLLKTFKQASTSGIYFSSIKNANLASKILLSKSLTIYESDIRLTERYLMERFIQGSIQFIGQKKDQRNHTKYLNSQCKKGTYHPTLTKVSLDIECSEKGILYSVGLDSKMDSRVIMIGQPEPSNTPVYWVENEYQLLQKMFEWFRQFDPDIIVGWNVIDFDFRLLHKRCEWHNIPFKIGRDKQTAYFRQSKTSKQSFITIPGRVVLDGIDTLKTATYHFRSWSLESVSQELLGEGKDIHNAHDRMDEINRMFREDKTSLAKYNLQDCKLVNRIFEHTHLIEFAIERSKLTGVELDKVGGSVAAFTNLYLPQLHRANYVAPNLISENWLASPGGYVMDSLPGLYDSVLVLDFKSLYPSIIRSFYVDPLGLIEGLKLQIGNTAETAVEGFRGGQFHREHHFLPKMIERLWDARDEAKKNNEKAFSQAIKIIMNSFYGVLGSSGCRFFDTRLASSITMRGHEIMKQTRSLIEEKGYQVIYGDTDSTFVALNAPLSKEEADKIGQALVNYINTWWTSHLDIAFGISSYLEIEYETHYRKFLMPTIRGSEAGSKKRYAGLVLEGNQERIVFKGLESVRTDWTPLSQEFQKTLYDMVFKNDNPENFIREYVNKTLEGLFDHKLVYQKRLRRRLSEYKKNIPPQVRAARLADDKNAALGRPLQYQSKGLISYIITLNGPEPKEYLESPIDYQHYIDKQLKPVADAILPFIGLDFESLNAPQIGLF